jgi:hypothetical protein
VPQIRGDEKAIVETERKRALESALFGILFSAITAKQGCASGCYRILEKGSGIGY